MIPTPIPSRRQRRTAIDPRLILLGAVGLIASAIALMLIVRD